MTDSPIYIMYVDDSVESPIYIPYIFNWNVKNSPAWNDSYLSLPLKCLGTLGDGTIVFSHTKSPQIIIALDTSGANNLFVRFDKNPGYWRCYKSYDELNSISLSSLNRNSASYRLMIDNTFYSLTNSMPPSNTQTRGTPTYYLYSNPITVDNASSYYYRVTFSPDNTVKVDKITFANTSVESV